MQLKLSPHQIADTTGIPAAAVDEVLATALDDLPLRSAKQLAAILQFQNVADLENYANDALVVPDPDDTGTPRRKASRATTRRPVLATLAASGGWVDRFALAELVATTVDDLDHMLGELTLDLTGTGLQLLTTGTAVRLAPDPDTLTPDLEDELERYRLRSTDPDNHLAHCIFQSLNSEAFFTVDSRARKSYETLRRLDYIEHHGRRLGPSDAVEYSVVDPVGLMRRFDHTSREPRSPDGP